MIRPFLTLLISSMLAASCSPTPQHPLDQNAVVQGINYVGLTVSDLDESTRYYTDIMAMERVDSTPLTVPRAVVQNATTEARTNLLRSVNAQLRLMQFETGEGLPTAKPTPLEGPGIAHVCFQVAQSTHMYQRAIDLGATPIGDEDLVQLIQRNPVYYGYAKDRDGIIFEVEEVDKDKIPDSRLPKTDYRIRHVSLATGDLDRLLSFYAILLDAERPRQVGGSDGISGERFDRVSGLDGSSIRMAWLQVRNLELEIFEYVSHPPEAQKRARMLDDIGYNFIVFDAKNLDRVRTKLELAGADILTDIDTFDDVPAIFARDPDSNLLVFQTADAGHVVSSQNFSGNGTE